MEHKVTKTGAPLYALPSESAAGLETRAPIITTGGPRFY